jgi:hypothetical protein
LLDTSVEKFLFLLFCQFNLFCTYYFVIFNTFSHMLCCICFRYVSFCLPHKIFHLCIICFFCFDRSMDLGLISTHYVLGLHMWIVRRTFLLYCMTYYRRPRKWLTCNLYLMHMSLLWSLSSMGYQLTFFMPAFLS